MYAREIDGQEYSFAVSGKLIMNVMVMYDREADSLWSQLLGQAVEGPRSRGGRCCTKLSAGDARRAPDARLVDEETGTTWAAFTGEGLDGLLAGTQLEWMQSTSYFWSGWKDW